MVLGLEKILSSIDTTKDVIEQIKEKLQEKYPETYEEWKKNEFNLGHVIRGLTLLHSAAAIGRVEIVKFFLEKGADVNTKVLHGVTPLRVAAGNGHTETVNALLKVKGIDVNKTDHFGCTALHWAAQNGHTEVVRVLLAVEGIDINATDSGGRTALHVAAQKGHTEVVRVLLAVEGIGINATDSGGRTALHVAAQKGHTEVVRVLLAVEGIDINAKDSNGCTALHVAAENSHTEVVRVLLAAEGIDINAVDRYGCTALYFAAQGDHGKIVKILKEKGAHFSQNGENETELEKARNISANRAVRIGAVFGVIATLAVNIGFAVAGLPILVAAGLAVVSALSVVGIAYAVTCESKPADKLKYAFGMVTPTSFLGITIGCYAALPPQSLVSLLLCSACISISVGLLVGSIAGGITYTVSEHSGKVDEPNITSGRAQTNEI
ncbi:ankyrin repeat domain-containing protein [Candidatus Wolbachia massiliensis]|uniref:Ankyrin repeat domain-containing protein n=1 Tax=Candidatus Wolbachia massiliensis TaxID=1845000 RepID=A0A7L7YL39_9RICK|nr:ankyrin repeat domain-containing protein [Candidatus Wolbachia massiliensis]QOD37972.1 ankyrin repeat domain-containing protein [Candidatus Wolbachia massiliensis]